MFSLLLSCFAVLKPIHSQTWNDVTAVLNNGISSGVFPGYVALVGYRNGTILYEKSGGTFVYPGDNPPPFDNGNNPPMAMDTHFDMASITKLMSTTTSMLKLIENKSNMISLYDPITKYLGSSFAVNNKSNIQIINCLLHNAGFHPDPVPYWYNSKQFGCPQSSEYKPILTFNCTDPIYNDTISQPLEYNTGTKMIYSDISFMTLSYVVGTFVKNNSIINKNDLLSQCFDYNNNIGPIICYFEAYVRLYIFGLNGLNMNSTGFVPSYYNNIQSKCAPTCNSTTTFNHEILQGIVQDPNSFANGGIFGHAGLFSSIYDVYKWSTNILNSAYNSIPIFNYTDPYPTQKQPSNSNIVDDDMSIFFDPQWTNLFLTEYQHSLSSRALGFDTNDFSVNDHGDSHVCGNVTYGAFDTVAMHTGFTGTLFCLDRERDLIYLLLTNRVYPQPSASYSYIVEKRREYSNALLPVIDKDLYYSNTMLKNTILYKQCNDSWRDNIMNTESLCTAWIGGSLISSISMGLNAYSIVLPSTNIINPSTLNEWVKQQNGYTSNNELINGEIIENINKQRIKFVGNFSSLTLKMLTTYLNGSNIVIGNAIRNIDQQQYNYKMDINRYVNIIGYSTVNPNILIARDPLLYQMRYNYNSEITKNYWIYRIS